jgi:hypothetical protein
MLEMFSWEFPRICVVTTYQIDVTSGGTELVPTKITQVEYWYPFWLTFLFRVEKGTNVLLEEISLSCINYIPTF